MQKFNINDYIVPQDKLEEYKREDAIREYESASKESKDAATYSAQATLEMSYEFAKRFQAFENHHSDPNKIVSETVFLMVSTVIYLCEALKFDKDKVFEAFKCISKDWPGNRAVHCAAEKKGA